MVTLLTLRFVSMPVPKWPFHYYKAFFYNQLRKEFANLGGPEGGRSK